MAIVRLTGRSFVLFAEDANHFLCTGQHYGQNCCDSGALIVFSFGPVFASGMQIKVYEHFLNMHAPQYFQSTYIYYFTL